MELQALLVLCGAGVAILAVVLLAGLFSTTGTSYEEAVAQQRKATTELLALASNKNKPKKAKKTNKKLAKKEKRENTNAATASEPESEAQAESGVEEESPPAVRPHVEFSPPEVIDIPRDTPPNVKIRKRGKDPKVKPILLNKEDPSCISDPSAPPSPTAITVSNHFEEIHPKDEFELLQSGQSIDRDIEKKEEIVEKKENSNKTKSGKGGKAAKLSSPPTEAPKEEPVIRERHNSGDAPKEQRKGKKADKKPQPQPEEVVEVVQEEVVPPLNVLQPSELTTEKLLKQAMAPVSAQPSPPAGSNKGKKNKKAEQNMLSLMAGDGGGVNVGELVRVVSEAVLSRTEIQILTDTLLNKQHDPLPQHSEWSEGPNDPMQKLKKLLAEKEKALADETEASQALHAKLKELRTSLNAERSRVAALSRAQEEAAATQRAELHTLQTRLQRLLQDNKSLAQEKMHLQLKLSAEGEVQQQRIQMEMHIQRLQETEGRLLQELAALQAEAAQARDSLLLTQQHAADLAQQLQESNRLCGEFDSQRQSAMHSEQMLQQELKQMQDQLSNISKLQAEVQRQMNRAQQAESNLEKIKEDAEKQKQQLLGDLSEAREKAKAQEAQLEELAKAAHNGLPQHNDTHHKANDMAKVESVIEALRAELTAAQNVSQDHKEQVAKLQEQVKQYQDKNNDLRTKNWKIMEALQSAEKSLQNKTTFAMPAQNSVSEAIVKAEEAHYKEVAAILKLACPKAAPSTDPGRSWLEAFAKNLKEVSTPAPAPAPAPAVDVNAIRELRSENEQLQSLLVRYKRIIDDTEGTLSRLQMNVMEEEQRWQHKIAELQKQIDDMTQHQSQSQKKIMSLETELRQAQQNSTKHSFADSERLTEENSRLMAGLTDKHNLDVYNGPSQVDLAKI